MYHQNQEEEEEEEEENKRCIGICAEFESLPIFTVFLFFFVFGF